MNKKIIITGDCHGNVTERINNILAEYPEVNPENIMIIVAGDVGINFWLNKTDKRNKKRINDYGCLIYCVRGNHEERPENIETYHKVYDDCVDGEVYVEYEFPNIRFFIDGGIYHIGKYKVLTIGGAYSVDKWYRLSKVNAEDYNNPKKTGWFPDEMLNPEEMTDIFNKVAGGAYDVVISHTAPIEWEPQDLFLNFINQDEVDKTMEIFLDNIRKNIRYGVWIFGHYHENRIERPFVEQYFTYFEELDKIWIRWQDYLDTKEISWWLKKSPNFYKEM